jgi:hypothetical protein
LLELPDTDVDAAGFHLYVAYASWHVDVSALWKSNQIAQGNVAAGTVTISSPA